VHEQGADLVEAEVVAARNDDPLAIGGAVGLLAVDVVADGGGAGELDDARATDGVIAAVA